MTEENKSTERSGILRILGDIRHGEAGPCFPDASQFDDYFNFLLHHQSRP